MNNTLASHAPGESVPAIPGAGSRGRAEPRHSDAARDTRREAPVGADPGASTGAGSQHPIPATSAQRRTIPAEPAVLPSTQYLESGARWDLAIKAFLALLALAALAGAVLVIVTVGGAL